MTDAVHFFFGGLVEAGERKREEQIDTAFKVNESVVEGAGNFFGSALDGGGIGNAPMRGDGMAGPDGADFLGSVITDGDDEIKFGRIGLGEFIPGFAAQGEGGQSGGFHLTKRRGMGGAFGMAACAVGGEDGKTLFC
jgi:hypothetical protein